MDSPPRPLRSSTSLRPLRTSSSASTTRKSGGDMNVVPNRIDRVGDQIRIMEGGRPNSNHAPGAFRINTPATNQPNSSIRRMMMSPASSSLHSGDGISNPEHIPSTITAQDPLVMHDNPSTNDEATISATVVRADSLWQPPQQDIVGDQVISARTDEAEGSEARDLEQPAPVEAGSLRKRRRTVMTVTIATI